MYVISCKLGVRLLYNDGVILSRDVLQHDPMEVMTEVRRAIDALERLTALEDLHGEYMVDRDVPDTLDDYISAIDAFEQKWRTQDVRKHAIHARRREFNAARHDLVLKLIDRGDAYMCAEPHCGVESDLTVDHIVPLSRGGTDDIENLRFLCRKHNSQKGNR